MSLPRLFKPFHKFSGNRVHNLISAWFDSDLGQMTLAAETKLLDQILPSNFGYFLMQCGVGQPQPITASSPIKHRFFLNQERYPDACMASIQSRYSDLSIAKNSIDVVVLHHSLDFDNNPHRMLREVSRTLIPGGKMVVVGFNPWSLWGLMRLLRSGSNRAPWCANFLSPYRLSDWLNLLDFEIEGCECALYGPPNQNAKWVKYFGWLSSAGKRWWSQRGAVYIMVATKRVARLTPLKVEKKQPRLVPIAVNGMTPRVQRDNASVKKNDE